MASSDPESLSADMLPTSHVYLPTTCGQVLSKYFHDNSAENECLVLGGWEVNRGKAGSSGKRVGSGEGVMSSHATASYGVVTRRQSGSRMKHQGGLDELKGPGDMSRMVVAVNVVGFRTGARYSEEAYDGDLKVVGVVRRHSSASRMGLEEGGTLNIEGGACPVFLNLSWSEGGNVCIETIYWKARGGNGKLILFYYDPEELQQWKVPSGYPLGVPKVVFDGLVNMQKWEKNPNSHIQPAFPVVELDHQDLNACSRIPGTSFLVANSIISFISSRSSGLQQILHKATILIGAVLQKYPLLPVLNFLFLMMLDSLVGYLVTRYLLQFPNMLGLLHTTVDQMLAKLNHLLKWLRGAPAGLKLNPNLNSLYWRFFSYHIHLWANYIGILEPVFAVILYTIQYFGVLGATIQISLLKDLLSLATFHVYCLYIYATRLYSLQTTAIKALCRVFFGRKYNPLRKRIDSVQLTTPELFLSSFGFVILIFLFPTTMVYYTGFVFLRVPVLLIERLLHYLVIMYNKLPVISWLLVYLKSPRVADEIYLVPVNTSIKPNEESYQNIQNHLAFRVCLQSTRKLFDPPNLSGGIKSIVSCVMDGTVLKD